MIQVTVHRIGLDQSSDQAVILLGDLTRTTFIPIWVRTSEATAIAIPIQGIQSPRPMTADLVVKLIDEFEADVVMAVVNDIRDEIFYASLVLNKGGQLIEIDCRPSDAIAVALRKSAPMYVEEKVMAEAGIAGDESEIQ
ncbi:MAG: bifunctional nuclease family protein [Firmicutes bacterium]|nr:bifunctional nuclease family protein [Candidatus Fermentithermobacillaceae bacterium]